MNEWSNFYVEYKMQECCYSDHKKVSVSMKLKAKLKTIRSNEKIKIETLNRIAYRRKVKHKIKTIENTTNIEDLIEMIVKSKREAMEIKWVKIKKRKSWLTDEIVSKIKERDILYKKMKKNPDNKKIERAFKMKKNEITHMIREVKNTTLQMKVLRAENDSRKMWKIINKEILCKEVNQQNHIEEIVGNDGNIKRSCKEIADTFSEYFVNIGETLKQQIKRESIISNQEANKTIFMKPATESEIIKIIHNLKKNSAPGRDGITTADLIEVLGLIVKIITRCVNKMFLSGIFPKCLKTAVVIPIYKSGDMKNTSNYRPISLLSVISKIFEKAIHERVKNFLINNQGYDENQYGFQQKSATESAVIQVTEEINKALDEKYYVAAVFIDLQKAFDTVDHEILLQFLNEMGIRGHCNQIFRSYLEERSICTRIGDVISEMNKIKVGVPQGSILGPLLYLIYINNMRNAELKAKYTVYADDTCLIYKAMTQRELEEIVNKDLANYKKWANGNCLTLNIKKTKYMIFKNKNKEVISPRIEIDKIPLERVEEIKYLGLQIDEKLSWKNHINSLIKKIVPMVAAIGRGPKLNTNTAKLVYNANVLSCIRYLIPVWSHTSKSNLERIQRNAARSLKILYRLDWTMPTEDVFKNTGFLTIEEIIKMEKAKFIYKVINNAVKTKVVLKLNKEVHNYNTRHTESIRPDKARTNRVKNGLIASASREYNKLPQWVKHSANIGIFTRNLKQHLREGRK